MENSFNLKRLAGKSASLFFTCNKCGKKASFKEAHFGCTQCSSKLFKVARVPGNPLINEPLEPYRQQTSFGLDTENGDKLNEPGTMDNIGGAGFGGEWYTPSEIHDGAEGEDFGVGGSSDGLQPDDSPVRDVNNHFDRPTGGPQGAGIPLDNLFDRIRSERKRR